MNKNSFSESDDQKSAKRAREGVNDPAARLARLRNVVTNLGGGIGRTIEKKPIAAVGIAAGLGFVLGGVFGSRIGRFAAVTAVGYAVQGLIDEVLGEGGLRKLFVDEATKLARGDRTAS